MTREQAALAISGPLMIAGLAAVALAQTWVVRLGGAAMVAGAAGALAVSSRLVRRIAWTFGLVGLAAVLMGLL
ncbi:MAG: hypothetical protein KGO51_10830 [Alphaproteobacteria bacterium]|nr:hypothetical protein [Alphaproteobacteria bacterium]